MLKMLSGVLCRLLTWRRTSPANGWVSPSNRMPERGEAIEWQDSAGDVVRGTYAGVWLLDSGMYVYYVPRLWRYADAALREA